MACTGCMRAFMDMRRIKAMRIMEGPELGHVNPVFADMIISVRRTIDCWDPERRDEIFGGGEPAGTGRRSSPPPGRALSMRLSRDI